MKRVWEDRRVRYGRTLGVLFCAAGFFAIVAGWHGMARVACADCQLPYIVSGGFGGAALVLFGVGLLVTAQLRSERLKLAEQFAEALRPLLHATSGNGKAEESVLAGRSTYHRPACRLVRERDDLDEMPVAAARAKGLSPCRVCGPDKAPGTTADRGGATRS